MPFRYTLSSLRKRLQEIEEAHGDLTIYGMEISPPDDDEVNVFRWDDNSPYTVQIALRRE